MVDVLDRDKIIILFSLLFASIFAALIPLIIARAKWVRRFISIPKITIIMDLAQGFGGGVLLGGGLLHLMADATEQISEVLKQLQASQAVVAYPWAPLLTCTSLCIIFFVEIILTAIVKAMQKGKMKDVDNKEDEKADIINNAAPSNTSYYQQDEQFYHDDEHLHEHKHGEIGFHDLNGKSKAAAFITAIILWISLSTHVRHGVSMLFTLVPIVSFRRSWSRI